MKMKTFTIVVAALVFLMLLGVVAPAMAYKTEQTFSFVAVGYPDPSNPGTGTIVDNLTCVKGQVSTGKDYGYPWGKARHYQVDSYCLNQTSYTGKAVSWIQKTFHKGELRYIVTSELTGLGYFTYRGPTIKAIGKDAQNNSVCVEVTNGTQFFGLLYSGKGMGCGVINHHRIRVLEDASGVHIFEGPLAGIALITGNGTYTVVRHGYR